MIFCKKYKKENESLKKEIEKLKEKNKTLKKENKKLKIINNFKDEIISAISHEFKNPISIINGYIETILSTELDENTKRKFLEKIHKNTVRLTELINRLYLITKLENKKIKPKFETFDLAEIAKNVAESLSNERIKTKLTPVKIKADKNLIEIVIVNLLTNALKYSSKEVILKITPQKLEVIDKGKGIDEKEIELIKKKFYRIAKNDWDNSLGLGLAIVEHILKLHATKLEIESEKGKGSNFSFDITSLTDTERR
jgi:signal transduction histidine kinase